MTIVERAHMVAQEAEHLIDHIRSKTPLNESYLKVEGHLSLLVSELAAKAMIDVTIVLCPSDITATPEGRTQLTRLRDCVSPQDVARQVKALSALST